MEVILTWLMLMSKAVLESLISKLPHTPGVYKMKDKEGRILYVGKAKDLSKRVRSYFRKGLRAIRTEKMLSQIVDLEWTEVESDLEALFLETNLIKEFHPKYNVLMKDDKNYVYIKITRENFPRILVVRRVERDGARYFGPKTSAHAVKKTLTLLQKLFMYRSCDLGIEWKSGSAQVTKKTMAYPCLDYHIKRCAGPCISKISPEEYKKSIDQIELFLEGKTGEIERSLQSQMELCVQRKEFEKAARIRDKLLRLKSLFVEQVVTEPNHENMDVLGFVLEGAQAFFTLFLVRDGKLVNQENFMADSGGFEAGEEVLAGEVVESFLSDYYSRATEIPPKILLPLPLEESDFFETWLLNQAGHRVALLVPERGKKHKLILLAEKNARSFQKQQRARWQSSEPSYQEVLKELANNLTLAKVPKRMECYDISHLAGTDTVASMVVFEQGCAKKGDYRKFHLRRLAKGKIDDFKSMEEILYRRLSYLVSAPRGFQIRKAAKIHQGGIRYLFKEWKDLETMEGNLSEFFVTLKQKKVVGMICLIPGPQKSFLLRSLYVDSKNRGKGLSRYLLRYATQKLKAKRIYLSCPNDRKAFYEKLGFQAIKTMPEVFQKELNLDEFLKSHLPSDVNFYAYDPVKQLDSSFQAKPDLIVVDGGKGQLSSALKSRNLLGLKIPMIALAKREEDVFTEGKAFPVILPKDSPALYLLQRIRDEAHRFAISFQRSTRKKDLTSSALDAISGIGKATKMKLLQHFGSVEQIKQASEEEVAEVVGAKSAQEIWSMLA